MDASFKDKYSHKPTINKKSKSLMDQKRTGKGIKMVEINNYCSIESENVDDVQQPHNSSQHQSIEKDRLAYFQDVNTTLDVSVQYMHNAQEASFQSQNSALNQTSMPDGDDDDEVIEMSEEDDKMFNDLGINERTQQVKGNLTHDKINIDRKFNNQR